jgi:hypothetical protein
MYNTTLFVLHPCNSRFVEGARPGACECPMRKPKQRFEHSTGSFKSSKRRVVFEQLLISDSWRKVFGFEKGTVLHGALEFRDKR